jgi:hypothetical protein
MQVSENIMTNNYTGRFSRQILPLILHFCFASWSTWDRPAETGTSGSQDELKFQHFYSLSLLTAFGFIIFRTHIDSYFTN